MDEFKYQVIVGNIGTVYQGDDEVMAMQNYNTYVEKSKSRYGTAADESVVFLENGEIRVEYMTPYLGEN